MAKGTLVAKPHHPCFLMRIWCYNELGCDKVLLYTERMILEEYYTYWCEQMKKADKAHLIMKEFCIEDWVVVNWAWRLN